MCVGRKLCLRKPYNLSLRLLEPAYLAPISYCFSIISKESLNKAGIIIYKSPFLIN